MPGGVTKIGTDPPRWHDHIGLALWVVLVVCAAVAFALLITGVL